MANHPILLPDTVPVPQVRRPSVPLGLLALLLAVLGVRSDGAVAAIVLVLAVTAGFAAYGFELQRAWAATHPGDG